MHHIWRNEWINSNEYAVTFTSSIRDMLDQKIIVGSLNQLSSIASVAITFYDQDNTIVQDDGGRLLQFTSSPVDLGHELELFYHQSAYFCVKFVITVLSDVDFDPDKIFFHFSQR